MKKWRRKKMEQEKKKLLVKFITLYKKQLKINQLSINTK